MVRLDTFPVSASVAFGVVPTFQVSEDCRVMATNGSITSSSVAKSPSPRFRPGRRNRPADPQLIHLERVVGLKKVRAAPPQPRVPRAGAGAERDARIVVRPAQPPVHLKIIGLTIPAGVEGALAVPGVVRMDHADDGIAARIRLGD